MESKRPQDVAWETFCAAATKQAAAEQKTWRNRVGRIEERVRKMEASCADVEEAPLDKPLTKVDELERRITHLERIMWRLTVTPLLRDDPFALPPPPVRRAKSQT